ncbi:hypothetical protein V8E54_014590 [Elaphomyces granulatus]
MDRVGQVPQSVRIGGSARPDGATRPHRGADRIGCLDGDGGGHKHRERDGPLGGHREQATWIREGEQRVFALQAIPDQRNVINNGDRGGDARRSGRLNLTSSKNSRPPKYRFTSDQKQAWWPPSPAQLPTKSAPVCWLSSLVGFQLAHLSLPSHWRPEMTDE